MGYNISFILSIVIVVQLFVFSIDLISVQSTYSELDSISLNVSFMIAKDAGVKNRTIQYIQRYKDVFFVYEDITPMFGEIFSYTLYKNYKPFIISNDQMKISVERATVIGYYN